MLVPIRPTPITPSSMGRSFLLQNRHAGPASDVGQLTEILVAIVVAALPLAERLVTLDELDRPDPLNHLEAELANSRMRRVHGDQSLQQCLAKPITACSATGCGRPS